MSLSEETPFESTLRNNIAFGDTSITDEDILWALEKTGLKKFLREQPKGLNAMIYPEGKRTSFTVSKKIILARAIVKKPKLLILEDPLDQFEQKETKRIMDFLLEESNPWTLIIVSQNSHWQKRFKNTIMLKEGKII